MRRETVPLARSRSALVRPQRGNASCVARSGSASRHAPSPALREKLVSRVLNDVRARMQLQGIMAVSASALRRDVDERLSGLLCGATAAGRCVGALELRELVSTIVAEAAVAGALHSPCSSGVSSPAAPGGTRASTDEPQPMAAAPVAPAHAVGGHPLRLEASPAPLLPYPAIFGTGRASAPPAGDHGGLVRQLRGLMSAQGGCAPPPSRRARRIASQEEETAMARRDAAAYEAAVKRERMVKVEKQQRLASDLAAQLLVRDAVRAREREEQATEATNAARCAAAEAAAAEEERALLRAKRVAEEAAVKSTIEAAAARRREAAEAAKETARQEQLAIAAQEAAEREEETGAKRKARAALRASLRAATTSAAAARDRDLRLLAAGDRPRSGTPAASGDPGGTGGATPPWLVTTGESERQRQREAVAARAARTEAAAASLVEARAAASRCGSVASEWVVAKVEREVREAAAVEERRARQAAERKSAQRAELDAVLRLQMQHRTLREEKWRSESQTWSDRAQQSLLSAVVRDRIAHDAREEQRAAWREVLEAQIALKRAGETRDVETSIVRSRSSAL